MWLIPWWVSPCHYCRCDWFLNEFLPFTIVDVIDSLMSFFLSLFQGLRVQMGVPFAEQTIQTFMTLFTQYVAFHALINSFKLTWAESSGELFWSLFVRHPSIRLSVCQSVNISHFHLLLQNPWANFNQTLHKASISGGDSSLYKWRTTSFSKGR